MAESFLLLLMGLIGLVCLALGGVEFYKAMQSDADERNEHSFYTAVILLIVGFSAFASGFIKPLY